MEKTYYACELFNRQLKEISEGPIVERASGNGKRSEKIHAIPAAFDIETTNLPENGQSIMYIWQFRLDGYTIIGRNWYEFLEFMDRLNRYFTEAKLVCYIHNASFEFQFLKGIHEFHPEDVFCTDRNKVLKFKWGNVEFRDSYQLSNMSLHMFTKSFNVEHQKLDGDDFDYSEKRYPWTELTDEQMQYCVNDVIGLQEAVTALMERDGDTLATIPLTSTGYVRRDVMDRMRESGEMKKLALDTGDGSRIPPYEVYRLARRAFRGGNTHANRIEVTAAEEDPVDVFEVHSYDRSSSYPDVIVNQRFPVGKWGKADAGLTDPLYYYLSRGYAVLADIELANVKLKDNLNPVPYLPVDKCGVNGRDLRGCVSDNGRIIHASWLRTAVTDVDFRIIAKQYDWERLTVKELWFCRYGYLPEPIREATREYYRNKTELKGIREQISLYGKSKALLNAIYGMMVQDACKQEYEYNYEEDDFEETSKDPEKAYHRRMRKQLPYTWGVWVSAWGRKLLQDAIDLAEANGSTVVYVDTDSVKVVGECDYSEYNAARVADSKKNGAFATDPKGKTHYMGVMEEEEDNYGARFRTMGAKKYAYEGRPLEESMSPDDWNQLVRYCEKRGLKCKGCDLHITIAGVAKYVGAVELWNMGGLDAFVPGTVFRHAGGTMSVYNNREAAAKAGEYDDGAGLSLPYTSNLFIGDSTYSLGTTGEYRMATAMAKEIMKGLRS